MEQSSARSETKSSGAAGGQFKNAGTAASVSDSVARGRDAIGAAASDAMSAAGSDLQSLRADLNSLKDTLSKFMAEAGNEAAKSARQVTSNLAGQAGGVAQNVADKSAEIASATSHQVKTFASELENIARRNPIGAMAAAVLVGVLIGVMGRRS
jgi:ElaB/YqjD/DUF883 family membrane-anchored ribosome-binding protein